MNLTVFFSNGIVAKKITLLLLLLSEAFILKGGTGTAVVTYFHQMSPVLSCLHAFPRNFQFYSGYCSSLQVEDYL